MSSLKTNALSAGGSLPIQGAQQGGTRVGLYSPEERLRRDGTRWTLVQGLLAPFQFLVFLISLGLVLRAMTTGEGHGIAMASVIVKTFVLFSIMITGSIWEKVVFGKWLFAPAFFWEDVVSMGVIALHVAYVVMAIAGLGSPLQQLSVALVAYAAYVVNASQFLIKLRAARLQAEHSVAAVSLGGVPA